MDSKFTVQEVAGLLDLNLPQVVNLINSGKLIATLKGGKRLISADSLAELVTVDERFAHLADKADILRGGELPSLGDALSMGNDLITDASTEATAIKDDVVEMIPQSTPISTPISTPTPQPVAPPKIETASVEQPVAKIASNTEPEKKKGGLGWLLPLIALLLIGAGAYVLFATDLLSGDDAKTDEDPVTTELTPEATVESEAESDADVVVDDTEEEAEMSTDDPSTDDSNDVEDMVEITIIPEEEIKE